MSTVIKIIDIAGMQIQGGAIPHGYVTGADVDFYNGLGRVDVTTDIDKARKFDNLLEAIDFWRQPSTVVPTRPDGEPNRPLTTYSVEFETVEEAT